MARSFCIINCTSRASDSRVKPTGKVIGFYRIPAWGRNCPSHVSEVKKRRRMAWIAAIRRPNITFENTPPHMLVCSKHFHKGKPTYEMLECDPDWAPSLKLGHTESKASTTARFDRLRQRSKSKQPRKGPRFSGTETAHSGEIHAAPVTTETTAEIQPRQITPQHKDEDLQECKMCSLKLQEIAHLQEENLILKNKLPSFALLMGVLQQISPSLPDTDRKISQFQMLLLTLMRLRLNLPIAHIAHLFDISQTTTSTVFNITLNVLYAHLCPLVHWLGRHCIQASMPHQYVEMFGEASK